VSRVDAGLFVHPNASVSQHRRVLQLDERKQVRAIKSCGQRIGEETRGAMSSRGVPIPAGGPVTSQTPRGVTAAVPSVGAGTPARTVVPTTAAVPTGAAVLPPTVTPPEMLTELFRRFDIIQHDIAALSQTVNQNDARTMESFRALQVGWDGSEPEEAHRAELEEVSSKKPSPQADVEKPEEAEVAHPKTAAAPDGPPSDEDDSDPENEANDGNRSARDGFARPSQGLIGADRPMKHHTSEDDGDSYHPLDKALKYFSIQLQGVQVSQAGDTAFPYARDTWLNCLREFPVRSRHEKALISVCFTKDASREYQKLSGVHPFATRNEMWSLLESQLWNLDHQATARNDFFALKMKKGETPMDFAARIRRAGGAVHEASEELYKQIFREGVPSRVKAMISLVNSQSTLSSLASGLQMAGVTGGGVYTDRELVGKLLEEEGDQNGTVAPDEMSEFVCKMTEGGMVAGPAPGLPVNPRFRETQCYKCNRLGHMARYCRWKDLVSAGDTRGGAAPASSAGN
jgi:hypothetical protein